MFAPHKTRTYGPLRSVAGIVLLFDMWMMFVPRRKNNHGPQRTVTGLALLFYVLMFVPHIKHIYVPLLPLTGIALYRLMSIKPISTPDDGQLRRNL
jgi:hypothetical protein